MQIQYNIINRKNNFHEKNLSLLSLSIFRENNKRSWKFLSTYITMEAYDDLQYYIIKMVF